jgi:DNA polymerase III delta subunit
MEIISGTEKAYQTDKPTKEELNDFKQKFLDHKNKYIEENSLESMVYENGSATALLFKEVQKLSSLVKTLINEKK